MCVCVFVCVVLSSNESTPEHAIQHTHTSLARPGSVGTFVHLHLRLFPFVSCKGTFRTQKLSLHRSRKGRPTQAATASALVLVEEATYASDSDSLSVCENLLNRCATGLSLTSVP